MRVYGRPCAALAIAVATLSCDALPVPVREGSWDSSVLGKAIPLRVYEPASDVPGARRGRRPGIVYLKNLASPRVGTEPDAPILADFLAQGYLVMTLDYGRHEKAVSPHIDADLRSLRRKLPEAFAPQKVDDNVTYILPEGYRLLRDVPYYGNEFHLDIRYPSKPAAPVALLMQVPVENGNRMSNQYGHWLYGDMIAECGMTRGYASAQVDCPLKIYRGVDPMPEVAHKLKAAVRTIRSKAKECNLNGKIAAMGFSRSSGQVAILAMSGDRKDLEGDGPNQEFSSRVDVAILHAGRMDHEYLVTSGHKVGGTFVEAWGDPKANKAVWDAHSAINYVTPDAPPTFLCVGTADDFRHPQLERMAAALQKAGVMTEFVKIPGMGHQVVTDVAVLDRLHKFLDKHLR